jgi:hypothetical protein
MPPFLCGRSITDLMPESSVAVVGVSADAAFFISYLFGHQSTGVAGSHLAAESIM